jgi:hypothetical protein
MPFDTPWLILSPPVGVLVFCAIHLASNRVFRVASAYRPLQAGAGIGLAAVAGMSWIVLIRFNFRLLDAVALEALNVFIYFAMAYCYFTFVNMNMTSLRIRILAEVAECGGRVPVPELAARYGMDHVAAIRVQRLIAGGNLVERNGRIHNGTRLLLFVAQVVRALQIAILGPASIHRDDQDGDVVRGGQPRRSAEGQQQEGTP